MFMQISSSHIHDSANEEPNCYLCVESHDSILNPLARPCSCKSRHVHTRCLQQWNVRRPCSKNMHCCEVCKSPYWGGKWNLIGVMSFVWVVEIIRELCGYNQ